MKLKVKKQESDTPLVSPKLSNTIESSEKFMREAKELVKTPDGLFELEKLLATTFPPTRIQGLLDSLCQAEDFKMSKSGDSYTTPNWDARKNGLDRVLNLLKFTSKDQTRVESAPVRIVFNVVQNIPAPKPVIDV